MWHWTKGCAIVAGALMLTLASRPSFAQSDWPTLKGDNFRSGRNANPLASNPGRSFLRWWRPNALDAIGSGTVVDNTSPLTSNTGGPWLQPQDVASEAFNPYLSDVNADPAVDPPYRYLRTVGADSNADPTFSSSGASTWTWNLTPPGGVPRNVGVYVWLPIGPTYEGVAPPMPFYTQRYFVYKVRYGAGGIKEWVEVIDTWKAGTGWVRIGAGGATTRQLFDYDGVNPIQVILYNTVPRDANNNLSDVPLSTLVYADAAMVIPDYGYFNASPTVGQLANLPAVIQTVFARNRFDLGLRDGKPTTITYGEVSSVVSANGTDRWKFRPNEASPEITVNQDNTSAGVTVGGGWSSQTLPTGFLGTDYVSNPIVNNIVLATDVIYAPTLDDGSYELWVHLQGSSAPTFFAQSQQVDVEEGATTTTLTMDADAGGGWVRLGTRRYNHTEADPLRIRVSNFSANPADIGKLAYADAVRFVGAADTSIYSTPVQANVNVRMGPGAPVANDVTIVCAENGRIYCLDSAGKGDGTTNVIWTYPSTPRPDDPGWSDPNQVTGEDGVGPIAEMPIGFDMSSALVQRVNGVDYLYVGTRNGRVYCIDITGRGDMDFATGKPGTTTRVWTYPDDYPSARRTSKLGPISGSIATAVTGGGDLEIIVPTQQGRVYALDAEGTPGNKTTDLNWTYPDLDANPMGPIVMTPAVAFNNVYFGSQGSDGSAGQFVAVNATTGALVWSFSGFSLWGDSDADSWISGPVAIRSVDMAGMPNTVVAANDNGYVVALDAGTGAVQWSTNELGSNVTGNLSFSPLTVYNNVGAYYATPQPCVIVPTADGRVMALFAETANVNSLGGTNRTAWGFNTASGGMNTTVAVGRNWMYATDSAGYVYGFDDDASGYISPGNPPGQVEIVPNDPLGIPFREARLVYITPTTYQRLRQPTGTAGHMTHAQANAPGAQLNLPNPTFEWGQTVYLMIYNYPYNAAGLPDPPYQAPQAEFRFNVEGASIRNITVQSKRFSGASPISGVTGATLDAYSIVSFTVQGAGSTAIPPGAGSVSSQISAQFSAGAAMQNVSLIPANVRKNFSVANPLAIAMNFDNSGNPIAMESLGYTIVADDPEAKMNGSNNIAATAKAEDRLVASAGVTEHNKKAIKQIGVYDRSLMTLIRGTGKGLDQMRIERSDLGWRGGPGAILKPLDPLAYPGFEDRPGRFPNPSIDYPDIRRERLSIVKDRFGNAEDPVYYGTSLLPPTSPSTPFDPTNRVLIKTPVDVEMNIPRFQPANITPILNSAGAEVPGGYSGRLNVYIDSDGNGQFSRSGGRREAYRSFVAGASVAADEKFFVGTPTVDLGTLPTGTGFRTEPGDPFPWSGGTLYGPNSNPYDQIFKTFTVFNEGNVNLTNLRLAKAYFDPIAAVNLPWGMFSPANHERSWLDTTRDLWSDIDVKFAPQNPPYGNNVILQKPRVDDRSPTSLLVNPRRRTNENLNAVESYLFPTSGPGAVLPNPPRVSATVPIGFPIGTYSSLLRVIEDGDNNESLRYALLPGNVVQPDEAMSDPGFTLRFTVREGRITNTYTKYAPPMMQDLVAGGERFLHMNLQPAAMRDQFGNLITAYASNNPGFNNPQPLSESLNDPWRLFIGSITGTTPPNGFGSSLMPDLHAFLPSGGPTFFRQEIGPFPTAPAAMFPLGSGETLLAQTMKFGAPAFPLLGPYNPYNGVTHAQNYMSFLGEAQIQASGGRRGASIPFVSSFTTAANGTISVINTSPLIGVEGGIKGRPSIVATGDTTGTVFFGGGGSGQTQLYAVAFRNNGTDNFDKGPLLPLATGTGFEYVGEPNAFARLYQGASYGGIGAGTRIYELTFTGKLRGRPHPEVFLGRLVANGQYGGPSAAPGGRPQFLQLPEQVDERLTQDGEVGGYRSLGVNWNINGTVALEQMLNGVRTNLEVPNTRVTDRPGNLITFDSVLGGKVYIDTGVGTVRFSGATPARTAVLLLRYTPRLLRVSTGVGAGYSTPTMLFDNRMIGEFSYWARSDNTPLVPSGGPIPDDPVRNARFTFLYGRAAAGAGQTNRPYLKTLRLGVQLPFPVHTLPNGAVTSLVVTGASSYYQIDPANGRVYFQDADENRAISITYTPVDEVTGLPLPPYTVSNVPVQLLLERVEAPIAMDQAMNESQTYAFFDPFDNLDHRLRRPGLVWMLWSSTRAGTPDIYFQTLAPRFTPSPVGRQ